MIYKFPDGFNWGSATSAHQIEGDNYNDWSEWEKSEPRLADLAGKGLATNDYISGKACDSYNRYEEDFDIAKKLNQNFHRFSIEWSRIEPEEGRFDFQAIQHYINVVKALKNRGIEPMITLWHFTNPVWFMKKGGWLNPEAPELFVRFIKGVVDNFKDEKVTYWATFNEATTIYAVFSYLRGTWPPQERSLLKYFKARRNIIRAHVLAYRHIKKAYGDDPESAPTAKKDDTSHNVMVGVVESNTYVPDTKKLLKTFIRRRYKYLRNFYFLDRVAPYYDFIGLNYYHMDRRPRFFEKDEIIPGQPFNQDMGWELYPPGIYHCLMDLKKYNKPVIITENGVSDGKDSFRLNFIKEHLKWTYKAINDGIDVRGYLYWSLLDNFEWAHGFGPKFGLVEVDYKDFTRHIRPSALEYAKICRENQVEIDP